MKTRIILLIAALLLIIGENVSAQNNTDNGKIAVYRHNRYKTYTLLSEDSVRFAGRTLLGSSPNDTCYSEWRFKVIGNFGLSLASVNKSSAINCEFDASFGASYREVLFIGLGMGVNTTNIDDDSGINSKSRRVTFIPVFVHGRIYFGRKKLTPYFDLKTGGSFVDISGALISPSFGAKLAVLPKMAVDFQMAYMVANLGANSNVMHSFTIGMGLEF